MKYRANPVIHLSDDTQDRLATPGMLARYIPEEGDYWVIQEDGYEHLNPKAVFERKYSVSDEPSEVDRERKRCADIINAARFGQVDPDLRCILSMIKDGDFAPEFE